MEDLTIMLVALTGTPGTGKTSAAQLLRGKNYRVLSLADIGHTCIVGRDEERDCVLFDITLLENEVRHLMGLVLLEGHITHLLPSVDKVVILRCHPDELYRRLQSKGWPSKKVWENVESEALDIIVSEAHSVHPENQIFEIDATTRTPLEVATLIDRVIQTGFLGETGNIDWSNWILNHAGSI